MAKNSNTGMYVIIAIAIAAAYFYFKGQSKGWVVGADGKTTRTNTDGSVDTLVAGGKLYIEKDKAGNTTLFSIGGTPYATFTQNADGSIDVPVSGGGYIEYDIDGTTTTYNNAGIAISN